MVEPRSRGQQPVSAPSARGSERRVEVDPARLAALDVLKTVRVDKAYTNLVLPAAIRHYGLEGRDAAFTTELAAGTIRLRGTYDVILAACVDRPLTKIEAKVLDALRLGTHQLLSMRVPEHAAISTTVDMVRARVSAGAAGFTNAVLRSVSEHDLEEWIAQVAPDPRVSPTRFASIAYSHPDWVVDELRAAVGEAELTDLLAADNDRPEVTLVARPGRSTREELPGEPTPYSPYGVVLDGGDPARSRPSPRGAPGCRTRAPSWSRASSRTRRWTARTGSGSTCARDRAARPRCWPPSRRSGGRWWSPTSGSPHRAPGAPRAPTGSPTA